MAYRSVLKLAVGLALMPAAVPASAQYYWKPLDLRGAPATGAEPDLVGNLPGATPAEQRAALVWNLRSGLNVAALQCQFDQTLLTLNQYNHLLNQHQTELASAFSTLTDYFKRTVKGTKAAQSALDQYGTRTYLGFSTVQGQRSFCQTASDIGEDALFQPRGQLWQVAQNRIRELRSSLKWRADQQFRYYIIPYNYTAALPNLDDACWTKKDEFRDRCRVQQSVSLR